LQELNTIKQRFLALNRDRLSRTRETLRNRQRDVMDLLPLLFHVNNVSLPGFVSSDTPLGISEYSPTKNSIDAAKKFVRGFDIKNKALPKYDIYAMFLMGSSGSIAYNSNSDFDIWLCHRPDLNSEQLALLQKKATAIEHWADEYQLEVHFFLMDAEKFKKGESLALSSESSGSAQHHLLLEEFYRTSLLFAGRYPMWWLVPPEQEANYEEYAANLLHRRFIRDGEIIDFGGMPSAPEQEFFGAALWQLYKSVDSPYKAVLKLMLMEAYAAEHPDVELLCMSFKKAIYNGIKDPIELDPYIMLYKKIEQHLNVLNDNNRMTLIQHCFYSKVGQRLSDPDTNNNETWQRDIMRELTDSWGWDAGYLMLLDSRPSWKIDRVQKERKNLIETLTQSYQLLSSFARNNTRLTDINQKDLHILGRKLYAAFERKAGKIEIINRGISKDMWEQHLSFHQLGSDEQSIWAIYQGTVYSNELSEHKPLKRSRSIIELITWAHMNKLLDQRTAVAVYKQDSTITLNDIKAISRGLGEMFPDVKPVSTRMGDLTKPPRLIRSRIFINVGFEPSKNRLRQGMHLTSDKVDALSYGGVGENLVLSIDHVLQNSWQEIMTYHYEGPKGLLECLSAYMQSSPPSQGVMPPEVICYCFTTGRGMTIAKRIEDLFRDLKTIFYNKDSELNRYILLIGESYYSFSANKDVFKHKRIGLEPDLLRYLSESHPSFSPTTFDSRAVDNSPLPIIFRNNKADVIQLFFQAHGTNIDVYILDEKGSMFFQKLHNANDQIMLNQFDRFINSVTYKQEMQIVADNEESNNRFGYDVEYYQIVKDKKGQFRLHQRNAEKSDASSRYFNLQVIGDVSDNGKPVFTLYCNEQEYSSLEFDDKVFHEVVKAVLSHRNSKLLYPIYITDIDLSRPLLGKEAADYLQTVYFLNYKRNIEEKLNRAMLEQLSQVQKNKKGSDAKAG